MSYFQYYDKLVFFVIITRYFMKTHIKILPRIQNKYSFQHYANFSHEIYVDLKKELTLYRCCHFKLATYISYWAPMMSKNKLQKLNMPSNAHNYANTTWNWTKLPPKKVTIQEFPTICRSKQFDKYMSSNCLKTYSAFGFRVWWKTIAKK